MRASPTYGLNKCMIVVILMMGLILWFSNSMAAPITPPNASSFVDTSQGFYHFFESVKAAVSAVLNYQPLQNMSLTFWKFFTVVGLLWLMAQYAMFGADYSEFFVFIFVVLMTKVLMQQYDTITTALWGWSEGFASGIQMAITGQSDLFWLSRYIWNATTAMSFGTSSLLHINHYLSIIVLNLISVLLCVLGGVATVWSLWGYALTKMIGFMFIPFILFERLSFLLDGWLRLFIGFIVYNVIARVNLVLVVVALQGYFNLPSNTIPTHEAMSFQFNSIMDAAGLIVFLLLSCVGLLCSSALVKQLVGGGSFSISSGVRQLAGSIGAVCALIT